jgi:hypothetical protein
MPGRAAPALYVARFVSRAVSCDMMSCFKGYITVASLFIGQLPFSAVLHHCCNEHNYKLWTLLQFLLDDMSQLGICQ